MQNIVMLRKDEVQSTSKITQICSKATNPTTLTVFYDLGVLLIIILVGFWDFAIIFPNI